MTKSTTISERDLDLFVESARIAPSSHNTQPWLFSISENTLFFLVDDTRHLAVADPTDRELYASIGCAIANVLVEAASRGYKTDLKLFPKSENKQFVATVSFSKGNEKDELAKLQPFTTQRLSNRFAYETEKTIPKDFLDEASKLADKYDVHLNFFSQSAEKKKLASLTAQAIFKAISSTEFRGELVHWVRHNWTKKTDGMPGYASGMPGVVSLLFPALLHSPSMPKMVSESEEKMVLESSGIVVLSTTKDTVHDWVRAGIALELIWLCATKHALGMSLLSGAVEYEEERQQVQEMTKERSFPNVFFRIGYPTKPSRPSPRRKTEDVLRSYEEIESLLH